MLLDGRAQETGIRRVGSDSTLLIVMNSHTEIVPFTLPEALGGSRWVRLIDTNDPTASLWRCVILAMPTTSAGGRCCCSCCSPTASAALDRRRALLPARRPSDGRCDDQIGTVRLRVSQGQI